MIRRRAVSVIGCGGTMATSVHHQQPMTASELLDSYGIAEFLPADVVVRAHDHNPKSSTEWTMDDAANLLRLLRGNDGDTAVDSTVVTFGTGTLEEVAFLAELTIAAKKPIVFTAALLPHGHPHSDGAGNLRDAILAATHNLDPGVYVVVGGEIHDPRDVTKTHCSAFPAFESPEFGPIGRVEDAFVRIFRSSWPLMPLEVDVAEHRVDLLKCHLGMGPNLLQHIEPSALGGLVVETLASGQVPPDLGQRLLELRSAGVPVVLASRCLMGRMRLQEGFPRAFPGDERSLREAGCLMAFESGVKARLRLLVGLSAGRSGGELQDWIEEGYQATER